MQLENAPCVLCGASQLHLVLKTYDYLIFKGSGQEFEVLQCESCLNASTRPLLPNKEMAQYYPKIYEAYIRRTWIAGLLQKIKYSQDISKIKSRVDLKRSSCFEIGAGRGEFLYELSSNCKAVGGTEPSEDGRQVAKQNYQVELQSVFAEQIRFERPNDVVIMRHVLEHVEDPRQLLEYIYKDGLREGGILFLKVPRFNSWEAAYFKKFWHGFDVPRHRYHFHSEGIKKLLIQIGYQNIKVEDECVPTDIVRSIHNEIRFGESSNKILSRVIKLTPYLVLMAVSQVISIILKSRGAGRIIVLAEKRVSHV